MTSGPSRYAFDPIGIVRSAYVERRQAPRQAGVGSSADAGALIELYAGRGYEDALEGLAQWEYAWVLFVFHKNIDEARGWRPKVQPPRSVTKRGVFATRSPHRPNPIGLSAVKIDRVDGLSVHVRSVDLLDGTPVLDLKPYVAYADAHPDARAGWLAVPDPIAPWQVVLAGAADEQIAWLRQNGVDLAPAIQAALAFGPQPHAYRRIRRHGDGMRIALKEWRADFLVRGDGDGGRQARQIVVTAIHTGFGARQLADDPALSLHKAFAGRFPDGARAPD